MDIKASVIIPAYNAQATIEKLLTALESQDVRFPYEVIVVDDGSTDNTAMLVKKFSKVVLVQQANAGPAAARNRGSKEAKGEFLCFTDSDCVPHLDWIHKLLGAFNSDDIGAVCGSYGIANPQSWLACGIHAEIIFRHNRLVEDYPKVFGSYNFCIRKQLFDSLGGFDCSYRRASGEDNDLSYRVVASGAKIFFQRDAFVDHHHTQELGRYLKEQFRHGYWRLRMYADHPAMIRGDGYTFWKDMVEVPFSAAAVALMVFCVLQTQFWLLCVFYLIFFLIFEMIFGAIIVSGFLKKIFYGFVMFLRSFARCFGLSTGFLYFLLRKL